MSEQNSVLSVDQLGISYRVGRRWIGAVREFCMEVRSGQIHGIVGESGSGKSTVATGVMRYLAENGRIEPGSKIEFMGDDLTQKSRSEMRALWGRRIKLVPQNAGAALNPAMKVGEQVAEVVRHNLGLDRKAAYNATIEMFQRVNLIDPEKVAKRYPHEISGGMQQRITIAMALMTDPELLVMDEPTTGLDVTTEAVILDLIRSLIEKRDAGVLYVTHNLGVVAQLCERVTVMYGGEIMVDGAVLDIFKQPVHPYTIGLLNSIPLPGLNKRKSALQTIEGSPPSLRNLPKGCVFAPRCPVAIDKCHSEKPPLELAFGGRLVRCHRWQEIASGELEIMSDAGAGVGEVERLEAESLLRVENLTKHFPVQRSLMDFLRGEKPSPIRAVDGINLGVQRGRTLGLVGESGSGKTTLSRVIIGLQERTAGKIEFMGLDIRNNVRERSKDVLAKLQMIFQNPQESLNPYMTVRQTIRRPLMKLRGMNRYHADLEVVRLLEAVNLRREYANRYPGELSGGEKQRVVIARAFASDPELVICDEPVSALDVSVQSAVLNLLAQLQDENETAYLFISHDLAVVGYLADYIAVMYLGELFEVGYGEEMFEPPFHPYTEALISAIPIPDPTYKVEHVLLEGELPSAQNIPSGCRFHTRCPHKIGDICEQEIPPWRDDENGHFIKCHIPLDELTEMQKSMLPQNRENRGG
ncbi:MAG TPA: dipeptide ABC transporter ATP-binding protein [Aggregatilineales bacterium]|nr:dipeptide ABC transporter ATP-binding protein [Aggregatilineales bacterium]